LLQKYVSVAARREKMKMKKLDSSSVAILKKIEFISNEIQAPHGLSTADL
jgi:hypothetical protein